MTWLPSLPVRQPWRGLLCQAIGGRLGENTLTPSAGGKLGANQMAKSSSLMPIIAPPKTPNPPIRPESYHSFFTSRMMSQSEDAQQLTPPAFDFEIDESVAPWNVSAKEWLIRHNQHWDGIASGNAVFNPDGKILIIQRALNDSMSGKWEIPGGAVDEDDPSLLYGAARELWEESGLIAKRFTRIVTTGPGRDPGQIFSNRTGTKTFCRYAFNVDVESYEQVKLDPKEHQDYAWATEDEIREQKIRGHEISITNPEMWSIILEAFRLRKERE